MYCIISKSSVVRNLKKTANVLNIFVLSQTILIEKTRLFFLNVDDTKKQRFYLAMKITSNYNEREDKFWYNSYLF